MRGKRRAPVRRTRTVVAGVIVGVMVLVLLPAAGAATVLMQQTDEPPFTLGPKEREILGPHAAPGVQAAFDAGAAPATLLARGTNTQPTGPYGVLTYELEELAIPPGVPIPSLGGRTDL